MAVLYEIQTQFVEENLVWKSEMHNSSSIKIMTSPTNAFLSIFEKLPFKATASGFVAPPELVKLHWIYTTTGSHWPFVEILESFGIKRHFPREEEREIKEEIGMANYYWCYFTSGNCGNISDYRLPPRGSSDNNPRMCTSFVARKCTQMPQIPLLFVTLDKPIDMIHRQKLSIGYQIFWTFK